MARVPAAALAVTLLGGCQLIFKLDATDATTADVPVVCPAGYDPLDIGNKSGRYRFSLDNAGRRSWLQAESDCKKDGPTTHLAVTGSPESPTAEINVLADRALQLAGPTGPDILIGMSARTGAYKWITAENLAVPENNDHPPWGVGEPAPQADHLCVEIDVTTRTLATIVCDTPDAYVCECDDFAEDPANF